MPAKLDPGHMRQENTKGKGQLHSNSLTLSIVMNRDYEKQAKIKTGVFPFF